MLIRCKHLTDLVITSAAVPAWHNRELQSDLEELLERFNAVRGIGNVTFSAPADLERSGEMGVDVSCFGRDGGAGTAHEGDYGGEGE